MTKVEGIDESGGVEEALGGRNVVAASRSFWRNNAQRSGRASQFILRIE